eukprot:scaffold2790_cov239-Pinguiococcus_pyrenoidosus.AAC.4
MSEVAFCKAKLLGSFGLVSTILLAAGNPFFQPTAWLQLSNERPAAESGDQRTDGLANAHRRRRRNALRVRVRVRVRPGLLGNWQDEEPLSLVEVGLIAGWQRTRRLHFDGQVGCMLERHQRHQIDLGAAFVAAQQQRRRDRGKHVRLIEPVLHDRQTGVREARTVGGHLRKLMGARKLPELRERRRRFRFEDAAHLFPHHLLLVRLRT